MASALLCKTPSSSRRASTVHTHTPPPPSKTHLDVLPRGSDGLLDELAHCLVVVTQRGLLQQGVLALDLLQAALNNLLLLTGE
jgi:hypothetical protein